MAGSDTVIGSNPVVGVIFIFYLGETRGKPTRLNTSCVLRAREREAATNRSRNRFPAGVWQVLLALRVATANVAKGRDARGC
jgi:hypothetical protein